MNPLTLVEAISELGFLIGFGLGAVPAAVALLHRNGSAWFLSVAGAAIVAFFLDLGSVGLVSPSSGLIALATSAVGLAAVGGAQITRRSGAAVGYVVLLLSTLGVWGTVPDTENATVLLGVVMGGAVGAIRVRSPVAVWSWIPILAVVSTVAVTEGQGRVSAPIGALAAFGVLLVHPVVKRAGSIGPDWMLLTLHLVLVVFGGRVAGTAETATAAAVLALFGLAFAAWLYAKSARWLGLREKDGST